VAYVCYLGTELEREENYENFSQNTVTIAEYLPNASPQSVTAVPASSVH